MESLIEILSNKALYEQRVKDLILEEKDLIKANKTLKDENEKLIKENEKLDKAKKPKEESDKNMTDAIRDLRKEKEGFELTISKMTKEADKLSEVILKVEELEITKKLLGKYIEKLEKDKTKLEENIEKLSNELKGIKKNIIDLK